MRPPLDLKLPVSRRRPLLAFAVSVGVHVVLFLVGGIEPWLPRWPRPPHLLSPVTLDTVPFFLPPPPDQPLPPPVVTPRRTAPVPVEPRPRSSSVAQSPPLAPPVDTGASAPKPPEPPPAPAPTPAPVPTPTPAPTPAPTPTGPSAPTRIGPELAGGKLWVQPLPLPPRELAQRLKKSPAQLADSAVTAIVQGYLDSIAKEPANQGAALPDWTTRIAGKKFGLDSGSIYIAGLRIPAAVLALLPIPGGNLDQNRAYNRMLDLRADIQQAAQRAQNLAEFKERIREIRKRKEQEEEFERRRREGGDAGKPAPAPAPVPPRDGGTKQQ